VAVAPTGYDHNRPGFSVALSAGGSTRVPNGRTQVQQQRGFARCKKRLQTVLFRAGRCPNG
jgi:hypothetical protein